MNRAERRRQDKEKAKAGRTLQINAQQLKTIKEQATEEAVTLAFELMLAIPVMILHDYYPKLMRKEVDGKNREERFVALCMDLYDTFQQGYVTLEELRQCLYEEGGIKIER